MIKLPPMRQISFSKTTDAIIERRKTVTRRWGWEHVKVGDCLRGIDKLRMNPKQPPSVTLCCVEVVSVHRVHASDREHFGSYRYDEPVCARDIAQVSLHEFADICMSAENQHWRELIREGLGHMTANDFIDLIVSMAPKQSRVLTRIEFKYREDLFEAWRAGRP